MELDSNTKGAIAEQAIVLAAIKLGVRVLRPVSEHGRTDLALDIAGKLLRVQVKWGRLSPGRDTITVVLYTSRCTTKGHVRATYDEGEVDFFAVYCGELDRCFLLPGPPLAGRNAIRLRLTPARDGQHTCINLADDFTFEGAVAQLARARGWQPRGQGFESPQLHSENGGPAPLTVGADACRIQFGSWIERVRAGQDVVVTRRGTPVIRLIAVAPAAGSEPGITRVTAAGSDPGTTYPPPAGSEPRTTYPPPAGSEPRTTYPPPAGSEPGTLRLPAAGSKPGIARSPAAGSEPGAARPPPLV
jgi:prevent-host-death family protein